jgi:septal ring factor EnvC (AmiA/AmiB activator)
VADEKDDRRKLEKIKQDILNLEKSIKGKGEQKGSLNSELKNTELAAAQLNLKINGLEQKLTDLRLELTRLTKQQAQLETSRRNQQTLIARQITSAYQMGNEESSKLLLNQEDLGTISRTLKYYDYFLRARAEKLNQYRETLQALKQVQSTITERQEQLVANRSALETEQQALQTQQQQRRLVLAQLNKTISSGQQQLSKLKSERGKLESILKSLEEGIAKLSLPATDTPFKGRKGKLPWPVSGRLSKYYGASRNADIRWDGWLVTANEGTPVKAVHHGRVIFSDYLRGHGLLIILDHGDGYMTLYAHNQVLLKETGEWVLPNEVIAKVGNTGGRDDHALYFEIRHNGKPTNPKYWMAKKS